MIPSEEFEEIILHKSHSDAQNRIQQIIQNFNNNLPNTQEQHKQQDQKKFLCKDDASEQDVELKFYEPLGLKKQQSDTSYDQKKNQLKSFAQNKCKHNNYIKQLELSSIQNQQQNTKPIQQVQSKNDEEISIIKFDDNSEELKNLVQQKYKFRQQIQKVDNKIEEKRKKLLALNPIDEDEQIKQDQQEIQIEINVKKQNQDNICLICGNDSEIRLKLLQCEHQFCVYNYFLTFLSNCYQEYLNDKINNSKVINIRCPQEGCDEIFPESVIQRTVSSSKFTKYLNFKLQIEIQNDENKKWCPRPGCEYYVERNPKLNIVLCKCGSFVCFNCGQLAHDNQLCQQAIEIDFQNALNKYSIKSCPKCQAHVEKNAGCNHMTCRCSYQYCWVCLQPYYEYHYRYWSLKGCAIWSNGRFKTRKVINHPDLMRWIFFLPRLILFLLRGPFIILKLLFTAFRKSLSKPYIKLYKKLYRSRKPRRRFLRGMYFVIVQIVILICVIIIFPFYFLFYRIFKEFKWIRIKGCGY